MRVWVLLVALCTVADAAPVKEEGRAIVFVVDRGLTPVKLEVVRRAVKTATYHDGDQIGVVAYGRTAHVVLSLDGKRRATVESTTEPTRLVAGLEAAHAMLAKSSRRRIVIVMTDGDRVGGIEPVLARMRTDAITVSAIGVESDNRRALARIARPGGGRYHVPADAQALGIAIQKELNRPPPGQETVAYVFVLDRSLHGARLAAARQAAVERLDAVDPRALIAVITFDTAATLAVRPQRAANRMRIAGDLWRVPPAEAGPGGMRAGLALALEVLQGIRTTDKRVVLFGTGVGESAIEVVEDMAAADITVAAVGVAGAKRDALQAIVDAGHGDLRMLVKPSLRMR